MEGSNSNETEVRGEFLRTEDPRWTSLLLRMKHDFYHLPGYLGLGARWQEQGTPMAFVAEEPGCRFFVPFILRSLPDGIGDDRELFDVISPRGFPGPLLEADSEDLRSFATRAVYAFVAGLRDLRVVSAYIRLHPLLVPRLGALEQVGSLVDHGDTVSIDLRLPSEQHWRQTRQNHRRDIGKATRRGYVARIDPEWKSLDAFAEVYRQSMERLGADIFWRLPPAYFKDLRTSLGRNVHLCVVEVDTELAAGAILTEVDGLCEYHLAGTADAHVPASPSKLVVDFARRWAKQRGNHTLHLAGSITRGDSLSHFKTGFSPLLHPVYSWRVVVDPATYGTLTGRTPGGSGSADHQQSDAFFPSYRVPVRDPSGRSWERGTP
jgi:hypothetical protein